ncbi:MAG: outer membrane lipoprotein-sorting protein [Saprospiraceae bacterium]|nr:MAG: outer membrane lipoprotein-sorting protein [Saprospiraceae bacterium]
MKYLTILLLAAVLFTSATAFENENSTPLSGKEIIEKVDANMAAENRIIESDMIIHGKRRDRAVSSKTWSIGTDQSFSEYLSPAREAGTKMLKVEGKLWIYTPQTDRTIQISGHMLRQSVMGSDLSYEDMMDDRELLEVYDAKHTGEEVIDGRKCYIIELSAKVEDVAYHTQKMWVDAERFVPLQQEMYAKSGQLLKRTNLSNIKKVDGRWFPMTMIYKDVLKDGKGTEYRITKIAFNQEIPDYIFTKAALKK